jgi:excisionase family DNA binding protein
VVPHRAPFGGLSEVERGCRAVTAAFHSGGPTPASAVCAEIMRHLTSALSGHVRRLHQDGLAVPREVEELTTFLVHIARTRQDPPLAADGRGTGHYAPMPDRLLITKGEVAERLSVSVRTIERLVANGRLPQVYVEHSARVRVKDLEAYVNSLTKSHPDAVDIENHHGGP